MTQPRIYLDCAATAPIRPEARSALLAVWDAGPANAASQHAQGRSARATLAEARARVAALVGAAPDEVVFTSGATEASNLAIRGAALAARGRARHVVSTRIEHSATKKSCELLAEAGWKVTLLSPDPAGRIDPGQLAAALDPGAALVSIIAGHNELGTIQDIAALAEAAHRAGALLHLDATQMAGYADLSGVPWDLLSLTGHKLGAPQGIGALVMRGNPPIFPVMAGGGQERGLRPGTVAVALAAAFGAAAEAAKKGRSAERDRIAALSARLGLGLPDGSASRAGSASVPTSDDASGRAVTPAPLDLGARALGGWHLRPENRLPHILLLGIDGLRGPDIVQALDEVGISASSSSACIGDARSHVLEAIGLPDGIGTLRLSLGWDTVDADIDAALDRIPRAIERLRTRTPFERARPGLLRKAEEAGLALSETHLEVAHAVLDFHLDHGILPGPRHLARLLGAAPRLDALFPNGMVTVASWLGLPVPHGGCKPSAV